MATSLSHQSPLTNDRHECRSVSDSASYNLSSQSDADHGAFAVLATSVGQMIWAYHDYSEATFFLSCLL